MSTTVSRESASRLGRLKFNCQYYFRNRPIVVSDALTQWGAYKNWSPEYLRGLLGDKNVIIKSNRVGVFDYNKNELTGEVESLQTTFDDAVQLILSGSNYYYIQQEQIRPSFPELLPDIALPYLIDSTKRPIFTNLWFGGKGCKSPLHYDSQDNFLCQIVGRKRVTLFPPPDSQFLYPAINEKLPHCSLVNVFDPDLAKFPLYETAQRHQVQFEIAPGDMLYIPRKWWHAVESLDVAVSVNTWWVGEASFLVGWIVPRLFSRTGREQIRAAIKMTSH